MVLLKENPLASVAAYEEHGFQNRNGKLFRIWWS